MLASIDNEIEGLLTRRARVALHFSGGKDSMACLFLLRKWLPRLTVYWVNTGDSMPETVDIIERCTRLLPEMRLEIVRSDVAAWREEYGNPSDLVPTFSSSLGRLMGFGKLKVSDRFTCCWSNVMLPMYQRMKADDVTGIIRGQKLVDMPTVPMRSGDVVDGFEAFYPLQNWTDAQVLEYLGSVGAPMHSCYELGVTGVDCQRCTAWWNEGHFKYLKKHHPLVFQQVIHQVGAIAEAVDVHLDHLKQVSLTQEDV